MAKFCTKCGTRNDDDDIFCVSCGNPLKEVPQEQPAVSATEEITEQKPQAASVQSEESSEKQNGIAVFKRRVGICILLSIVTIGIYAIYWQYLLVKNARAIKGDDSNCTGEMLCLLFVPFYSYYWWFTRGDAIKKHLSDNGKYSSSSGALYLILAIFGLSIVAAAIMQNDFNSLKCVEITRKTSLGNKLKVLRLISICLFATLFATSAISQIIWSFSNNGPVTRLLLIFDYYYSSILLLFSNWLAMLFVLLLPLLLLPRKKASNMWFVPGALISVLSILCIRFGYDYPSFIIPPTFSSISFYLSFFLMCAGFTLIGYCSFSRMRNGNVKPAFRLTALSAISLTILISIIGAITRINFYASDYGLYFEDIAYSLPLFYFAVAAIGLLILYIDKKALIKRTWFIPGILVLVLIIINTIALGYRIGRAVISLIIDIPLCAGFFTIGLWCKAYSDEITVQSIDAVEPTATEATAE